MRRYLLLMMLLLLLPGVARPAPAAAQPAAQAERPFGLPFASPPGPDTWLLVQADRSLDGSLTWHSLAGWHPSNRPVPCSLPVKFQLNTQLHRKGGAG